MKIVGSSKRKSNDVIIICFSPARETNRTAQMFVWFVQNVYLQWLISRTETTSRQHTILRTVTSINLNSQNVFSSSLAVLSHWLELVAKENRDNPHPSTHTHSRSEVKFRQKNEHTAYLHSSCRVQSWLVTHRMAITYAILLLNI